MKLTTFDEATTLSAIQETLNKVGREFTVAIRQAKDGEKYLELLAERYLRSEERRQVQNEGLKELTALKKVVDDLGGPAFEIGEYVPTPAKGEQRSAELEVAIEAYEERLQKLNRDVDFLSFEIRRLNFELTRLGLNSKTVSRNGRRLTIQLESNVFQQELEKKLEEQKQKANATKGNNPSETKNANSHKGGKKN